LQAGPCKITLHHVTVHYITFLCNACNVIRYYNLNDQLYYSFKNYTTKYKNVIIIIIKKKGVNVDLDTNYYSME
jgi:hypothetical protein